VKDLEIKRTFSNNQDLRENPKKELETAYSSKISKLVRPIRVSRYKQHYPSTTP
jgi:hypothetical protein